MRVKWRVVAVVTVLTAVYFGYPYATLYRLDIAMRQADAATLRSLVDWYAVREGLKEDICDMVLDEPAAGTANARPANELPPFGSGFVRGIAANTVDQNVTPETLVLMSQSPADKGREGAHVVWAFFSNPTRFAVDVRTADAREPIRMMMELRDMRWQVRRVWLPNEMLGRASSGT